MARSPSRGWHAPEVEFTLGSRQDTERPAQLARRSQPVIGHAKSEHRMGRNFLKGTHGDAVLAAAGYNLRRVFIVALIANVIER
jgi:hypothetical protein